MGRRKISPPYIISGILSTIIGLGVSLPSKDIMTIVLTTIFSILVGGIIIGIMLTPIYYKIKYRKEFKEIRKREKIQLKEENEEFKNIFIKNIPYAVCFMIIFTVLTFVFPEGINHDILAITTLNMIMIILITYIKTVLHFYYKDYNKTLKICIRILVIIISLLWTFIASESIKLLNFLFIFSLCYAIIILYKVIIIDTIINSFRK